jgi:hypothetical protein
MGRLVRIFLFRFRYNVVNVKSEVKERIRNTDIEPRQTVLVFDVSDSRYKCGGKSDLDKVLLPSPLSEVEKGTQPG